MTKHEIDKNWDAFSKLINQMHTLHPKELEGIAQHYLEHNASIINEILALSIEHIEKLPHLKNPNDVLCLQAKLTHAMTKKLSAASEHFMHNSLGHETDYNEWLKSHCDLATD